MIARQVALIAGVVTLIAGWAMASAQSSTGRQPIRPQMTCSDFLRLDALAWPEIVYWFATRGNPSNDAIDVDATDSMVPVVVERCKAAPRAAVAPLVRAEASKLRRSPQSP